MLKRKIDYQDVKGPFEESKRFLPTFTGMLYGPRHLLESNYALVIIWNNLSLALNFLI